MAATSLFNDKAFSDITLIQICDDEQREYAAHKAVLCTRSAYFMNAFQGGFKEATNSEMVLYDDDPDHFEFALKFMYTLEYDVEDIKDNKLARFALAKGVCMVADKYKIKRLVQFAAEEIKSILIHDLDFTTLSSIISHHYTMPTACDEDISQIIAPRIFQKHHSFTRSDEFARVCTAHPVFASELMVLMRRVKCRFCHKTIIYNDPSFDPRRVIRTCPECDFNITRG